MHIRLILAALLIVALVAAVPAQEDPFDGLTWLGTGHSFTDENGASLELMGFHTKYKEKVVGMYFKRGSQQVHFYMNLTVWDKMKQTLIKARDQWETLSPREFEYTGAVNGYQIANRLATLTLSVQGATALDDKRLQMSASGGASVPTRVSVSLNRENVKKLVGDLHKVDALLRQNAGSE